MEVIRLQHELPAAWQEDAAWVLPEPDVSPVPPEIAEATIDLTAVLASWRDAESPARLVEAAMYDGRDGPDPDAAL